MPPEVRGVCPLIQVFDMPTSLAFYCERLGFEVVSSAGPEGDMGWAWLRLGTAEIMLNTQYELPDRPAARDPLRHEHHLDTALYFGCPDVDGMYQYLRSRGVEPDPPSVAPYGMKQMYLRDPDGYNLCFQSKAA